MELIAAIVLAGPLGYFARTRRRGLLLYLAAWAIIFPVQSIVVWNDATGDDGPAPYLAVNAVILALGIGLNRLGHRMRGKRSGAGPDANQPASAAASRP